MVELISGPDTAWCAKARGISPYQGNAYWYLVSRLCEYNSRSFPIHFGYLTQGNSKPKLNWNEVWNLQANGSISKRSVIPLGPVDSSHLVRGSAGLLTPITEEMDGPPSSVIVPVGTKQCLVDVKPNSNHACLWYWVSDTRGAGYSGYAILTPSVYRLGSRYRLTCAVSKGSHATLPEAGLPLPQGWRPTAYSQVDWFDSYPSVAVIRSRFLNYVNDFYLSVLDELDNHPDISGVSVPAVNYNTQVALSNLYSRLSARDVKDYLNHWSHLLIADVNSISNLHVQELEGSAFDTIQKFDGNFYVYLSKLGILGSTTLQSMVDLYKSENLVKGLSGYWLANRFGDRLQLKSTVDLVNAVFDNFLSASQKPAYILGRSRRIDQLASNWSDAEVTQACELALLPKDYNRLMSAIRHAYEWDYFPSLANVWDAVPLSFVVNWFLDISSIFQDVDRMVQARYYDVACIMNSRKVETVCPIFRGVTFKYYAREFTYSLNLGVSGIHFGLPSTLNIVDGISLVASLL